MDHEDTTKDSEAMKEPFKIKPLAFAAIVAGRYSLFTDRDAAERHAHDRTWRVGSRSHDSRPEGAVVPLFPGGNEAAKGNRCNYAGCYRRRWFAVGPHEVSVFCEKHHRALAQCGMTMKGDDYKPPFDPSGGDNPMYSALRTEQRRLKEARGDDGRQEKTAQAPQAEGGEGAKEN